MKELERKKQKRMDLMKKGQSVANANIEPDFDIPEGYSAFKLKVP